VKKLEKALSRIELKQKNVKKMIGKIGVLLIVLFAFDFISCKNNKVVKTEQMLQEWLGKVIYFPANVYRQTIEEEVTTVDSIRNYKILIYTDSTGCTSCKLHILSTWETYIKELGFKVDFMFYFHPKNERELIFTLKNELFDYPVYIDNNDELNKLNKFPRNPVFQCFLLDKNNKVLAIGNPTNNVKIWELYKKIITGEISDKSYLTTITVKQTETELNDLQIGRTSEAVFVIKNTGTNPLVIQQVISSCGCIVPEWEKHPIASNRSIEINVKITPEKREYFNKTVTVHCNTKEGWILLKIRGMVW
jgi:hypothetical protein